MEAQSAVQAPSITRKIVVQPLNAIGKYRLKHTMLLTLVPLVCGVLLLLLLSVFAKLNLYYLEANGLLLQEQVREAYFKQVELELWSVAWYVMIQVGVTLVAAYMVMRWASAPFLNAQHMLQTALENPAQLKPLSRWLSESPAFDRIIWNFALKVKNGSAAEPSSVQLPRIGANFAFLTKFCLVFVSLSLVTGYVTGILLTTVYERIVTMAVQFVNKPKPLTHFFVAQQEILADATSVMTGISLLVYFVCGLAISNYMATMLYVFARTVRDEKFPLVLRLTDIYHELAETLNAAHDRIKNNTK